MLKITRPFEYSRSYMKQRIQLILMCAIGGLLLAFLLGRHEWKHAELAPDSTQYHFLAVNILSGKGYYEGPISSIENYDTETIKRFARLAYLIKEGEKPSMGITPGYPLFLAFIYKIHGVFPDTIVRYQIALTALTGALMILIGWLIWGFWGAWAGVAAVFLLGMNREASYQVPALLTETLGTFLLTASLTCAAWAKRGSWKREVLTGFVLSLAILTRHAFLFTGFLYGLFLLVPLSRKSMKKASAYALPCLVLIVGWNIFASVQSGHFVFGHAAKQQITMGLHGETGAKLTKKRNNI